MLYREFRTEIAGLERKLGILGEVHFYTKEESKSVAPIVSQYSSIAKEGCCNKHLRGIHRFIRYVENPLEFTMLVALNRTLWNETVLEQGIKANKEITFLEDCPRGTRNPLILLPIAALNYAILWPILPFVYPHLKSEGDPFKDFKKLKIEQEIDAYLSNKSEKIKRELQRRDQRMGARLIALLRTRSNLLTNCGMFHVDGIIENLQKAIPLQEVQRKEW